MCVCLHTVLVKVSPVKHSGAFIWKVIARFTTLSLQQGCRFCMLMFGVVLWSSTPRPPSVQLICHGETTVVHQQRQTLVVERQRHKSFKMQLVKPITH